MSKHQWKIWDPDEEESMKPFRLRLVYCEGDPCVVTVDEHGEYEDNLNCRIVCVFTTAGLALRRCANLPEGMSEPDGSIKIIRT